MGRELAELGLVVPGVAPGVVWLGVTAGGSEPPIAQPKYLALRSLHAGSVLRKKTDTRESELMAPKSFPAHRCMAAMTRPFLAFRATLCLLESNPAFSMPSTAWSRELRKVLPHRTSVRKPSRDRMLLFATAAGCTGQGNIALSTLSTCARKALYRASVR